MDLLTALRLKVTSGSHAPCLALVGAGGKTTAMFGLARQLAGHYPAVLLTTTTHLAVEQAALADRHVVVRRPEDLSKVSTGLEESRRKYQTGNRTTPEVILFSGEPIENGAPSGTRLGGLSAGLLQGVIDLCQELQLPLLVEADGSRRLPLKAPAEHEPAIPEALAKILDSVVVLAGLSGLGKPLGEQFVHRSERFARLSGLEIGQPVSEQALAAVLVHPQGGLKNIPAAARRVCLLNVAERPAGGEITEEVQALVERLLPVYQSVLIASLEQTAASADAVFEPLAGVILAAGEARRFGQPKQLLRWQGEPLVRRAARLALAAGLHPVRVVVGAHSQAVVAALQGLPVRPGAELEIVQNEQWATGQSSSVKAGLEGLPSSTGGALFLLCDQPYISLELLLALRQKHAQTLASLVAPWCAGRRANPVIFDRLTFPELLCLQGDTGGRSLFNKPELYPPAWLPWADERLLCDIDVPTDYELLRERAQ